MKTCPAIETLSKMAAGKITGRQRQALLKHVSGCAVCRRQVTKLANVSTLLSSAHPGPEGKLSINPPKLDSNVRQSLKAHVLEKFTQQTQRRGRVDELLEEALNNILAAFPETQGEPASLSYRGEQTARTGSTLHPDAVLKERIGDILALLSDSQVPLETRRAWSERLRQLAEELWDEWLAER